MKQHPHALHIGFSKCASTFLQNFFSNHPDIFFVSKSHFVAPFDCCTFDSPIAGYRSLFEQASPDQVSLESDEHIIMPLMHPVLESAATTLESVEEVARRILRLNEEAKIILVVRNQVDLLVSRYSEYVLAGGTRQFGEFVSEFLCCSEDGVSYLQNFYWEILQILRQTFGRTNVLLLIQEELQRDAVGGMTAICDFLGIALVAPQTVSMRARRKGLSYRGIRTMRFANRILVKRQATSFRRASVRGPYGAYKAVQVGTRVADYYAPKGLKGDKQQFLDKDIVTRIRSEFARDNARLGTELGRDLGKFGY
jgi:hypothetical protein